MLVWIVRKVADTGVVLPLVIDCARKTEVIGAPKESGNPVRVLALSPERFLGDLKALVSTGEFKIYIMPRYWQYAGLALHGEDNNLQRRFLERFLVSYLRRIPIDIVVGTSVWYRQDIPWGAAAQRQGIPYVILHKECFKPEPLQSSTSVKKALKFGPFMGERLLVHNRPMADAFVANGYVAVKNVAVCGAMRMDPFVNKALSSEGLRSRRRKRPLVTFFSFTLGMGLDDRGVDPFPKTLSLGWKKLFSDSHVAFAKLAIQRPDVDFIIKTKWDGQWAHLIKKFIRENGVALETISNIEITSAGSAHDLIFDSAVVCSFASTTMLEAALAGKPVVVPHFGEVEEPEFRGRVKLLSSYHLFDVATSKDEFQEIIKRRLIDPSVTNDVYVQRLRLFELWVSPVDQSSMGRYVAELKTVVKDTRGLQKLS